MFALPSSSSLLKVPNVSAKVALVVGVWKGHRVNRRLEREEGTREYPGFSFTFKASAKQTE